MSPFNILTQSTFECILFFYMFALLFNLLAGYKTNTLVDIKNITHTIIGFLCQKRFKGWGRLAKSFHISLVSTMFSPYMY